MEPCSSVKDRSPDPERPHLRFVFSRIGYSMISAAEEAGVIKPGVVGVLLMDVLIEV